MKFHKIAHSRRQNRPTIGFTTVLLLAFLTITSSLVLAACGSDTTTAAATTTAVTTTSTTSSATTTTATSSSATTTVAASTSAAANTPAAAATGASAASTSAAAGTPAATAATTVANTPAPTPSSTEAASVPDLTYPGSRTAKASDTTTQAVLKQATGAGQQYIGDLQAQTVNFYFTADSAAKIQSFYTKLFSEAGYQVNDTEAGQGLSQYVFQKGGTKIVIDFGPVGDTTQLPPEYQKLAQNTDNLILVVSGKTLLDPTVAPTPFNIPGSPVPTMATGQQKIATITLENGGVITMQLFPNIAPITVENFEKLANRGFYDGLTFHRIVAGFVVQGGDPNGDGSGGPGTGRDAGTVTPYSIPGEFTTQMKHDYGVVAMARAQDVNSAGSQFYIVTGHAGDPSVDNLNGKYAIFGKVLTGMDLVVKIQQGDKMKTVRVVNK